MRTDHDTSGEPPDLDLRAAEAADAEPWCGLMTLPGVRRGTTQRPFASVDALMASFNASRTDGHLVLAFHGDALVGSASLRRLPGRRDHVGEIGLVVHDAWVGRRIGTALLAALIDLADRWLGLARLQLTVNTDNLAAVALYRRAGFETEGTFRRYLLRDGHLIDGYAMARLRPN